jgi:tetratricopeptide (TPR) repeat protein
MGPLLAPVVALALVGSGDAKSSAIGFGNQAQASSPAAPAENDVDRLLDGYDHAVSNHNYSDALAIASSLHPDNPTGEAIVDGLRAGALIGLKRDTEAKPLIAEANRLAPESIEPTRIIFFGALNAGRMEFAADALDRMIARAPDAVREIETYIMESFFEKEPAGDPRRNQDRRIALARIGYGGETPTGRHIANEGVDLLVRRGDVTGAESLLPFVLDPQTVEDMLITRRYAPLWPKLAEIAGPNLMLVRRASVRAAQRAYEEAPRDSDRLQTLVNALRDAGLLNAAISYRSKLPQDQAAMSTADERMGWAINNVAMALYEAGQPDEADRLFTSSIDAPLPDGDWRIAMKVNRLELLVDQGKLDRALRLIEPTAATKGTPYADQLTRDLRYCTLRRLGRSEQAAKYLPDLMAHAEDAAGPTMDYLLCAGETGRAETLALAQLKNPDEDKRLEFEGQFVRRLQARPLTSDDPSAWENQWRRLRQRPTIAAEFNRLGRDMPEILLPPESDLQQ